VGCGEEALKEYVNYVCTPYFSEEFFRKHRAPRNQTAGTLPKNNHTRASRLPPQTTMTKRKLPPSSLQHNLIVPLTPTTRKLVTRLSKASLTALALRWLDPKNVHLHSFNLRSHDDEDESSLAKVTEAYSEFARNPRVRGKDVAERILEYEWRDGLTLLEIAELEWQCTPPPPPRLNPSLPQKTIC
jgi:hypothetical protein